MPDFVPYRWVLDMVPGPTRTMVSFRGLSVHNRVHTFDGFDLRLPGTLITPLDALERMQVALDWTLERQM